MHWLRHRRVRGTAAFALTLALLAPASVALADTEKGHSGAVGTHMLVDTEGQAGTTCAFKSSGRLKTFIVRAPRVWARDVTGGTDRQQVGWRFIVQRQTWPGPWKNFYVSSIQKLIATDGQPAAFGSSSASPQLPANDSGNMAYRVLVEMSWYRPNGQVEGKAKHLVDWYRWRGLQYTHGPGGFCPPATYFLP